ncbi:PRCC protein, partial [Galbula dea]|nr:PRCC protein [Galbula dea]
MSLVAYASSEEESDAEEAAGEEEEAAAPPSPTAVQQPPARGLFATLPPPKAPVISALPPPQQPLGSGFPLPPPHGGPPPPFLMGPPPGMRGFNTSPPGMSPAQAEPAASGNGSGEQQPRAGGPLLPPPRNAATTTSASPLNLPPPVSTSATLPGAGLDLNLPKSKKRTEPVKIAAPELHKGDSDSEEEEPATKKNPLQARGEGSGLAALLPQPKNLLGKESNRVLLPSAVSRRAADNISDSKAPKTPAPPSSKAKAPSKAAVATSPSPSAIKAAAKSAALQVTKQITQEEEDSEEELEPENYFSLPAKDEPQGVGTEAYGYPSTVLLVEDPPPGTEPETPFQDAVAAANAPLEFKTGAGSSGVQHSWVPKAGEDYSTYGQFPAYSEAGGAEGYYQDYYSTGYYPEVEAAQAPAQELSSDSSFLDDEA